MNAPFRSLFAVLLLLSPPPLAAAADAPPPACSLPAASPWITAWMSAWELTSREILSLPDAPAPNIVLFDSACVYTTSEVTAGGASPVDGPTLLGAKLPWRAIAHGDSLTLPTGSNIPVQLMSFTSADRKTGPYFVMAAPSYWARSGRSSGNDVGLTGVFLHEFSHTRQLRGLSAIIGRIDSTWSYPEELDDDAVQTHFGNDSSYVAAYLAERDLLYRAAAAGSRDEVRALAKQALAMIRARHARWFTGARAEFTTVDDTFLSLEGAGQWVGAAWLAHPKGGGMTQDEAVKKMLGKRRWWVQDEGLALFLVVDRLLPRWPLLVFDDPSVGATDLLAKAVR
jgi:hypothetical protein